MGIRSWPLGPSTCACADAGRVSDRGRELVEAGTRPQSEALGFQTHSTVDLELQKCICPYEIAVTLEVRICFFVDAFASWLICINIAMLQRVERGFKKESAFAVNTLCRAGARSTPLGAIGKQG